MELLSILMFPTFIIIQISDIDLVVAIVCLSLRNHLIEKSCKAVVAVDNDVHVQLLDAMVFFSSSHEYVISES